MRRFAFMCVAAGIAGAVGCGNGKEKGRDTYMLVGGGYCTKVTELQNTCGCDGPRGEFPNRIIMNYLQESDNEGVPNGIVDIDGGGVYFGAYMTKDGYLSVRIENYEVADPMIDRVVYNGVFTGTSNEADFATRHDTVGPENGDPCEEGKPCHFRFEYHAPYCCNASAGYNVIKLSGEKVHSTGEAEACVNGSAASFSPASFIARP